MKIEANCPKCLKIKIAEKDILDCFICPFCNSIIAKLHKWSVNGGETKCQIEMEKDQEQEAQNQVNRKVVMEEEIAETKQ